MKLAHCAHAHTWVSERYKDVLFGMRAFHDEPGCFLYCGNLICHGTSCVNDDGESRALVEVQQVDKVFISDGVSYCLNVLLTCLEGGTRVRLLQAISILPQAYLLHYDFCIAKLNMLGWNICELLLGTLILP